MRVRLINFVLIGVLSIVMVACDSNQEKHQQTLEEQLVDNFASSDQSVRERVAIIVEASKNKNYTKAMNELGILSASQINNSSQEYAIKRLMEQLRFNMEEEELARRDGST